MLLKRILQEKKRIRCLRSECILLLFALFLETVLFQINAFETAGLEPVPVPEEVLAGQSERELILEGLAIPTKTVQAIFSGDPGLINVYASISDDSAMAEYVTTDTAKINPAGKGEYAGCILQIRSRGLCRGLKLTWGENARLEALAINVPVPFHFRPVRFAMILGFFSLLNILLSLKLYHILWDPGNRRHKTAYRLTALVSALVICVLASVLSDADKETSPCLWQPSYPLDKSTEDYCDIPHALLFDALMHGRVYLDVEVPQELLESENPYDRSVRAEGAWFDYSYYNGRIYVYFGPAPVILFYLPYYLLSGSLPSYVQAGLFFSVMSVIGGFMMLWELAKRYLKRIRLVTLLFAAPAVVFGTDILFLFVHAQRYDLNCLSAVCTFFMGLWAGLRAVAVGNRWKRSTLFVLSALFSFLLIWSRPTAAIGLAGFLIPLFVFILLNRSLSIRTKLNDALSYCVPLVLLAVIMMYYNAVRFDSPFEFGAIYQLTSYDVRQAHVDLRFLLPAEVQGFLVLPQFRLEFPWLYCAGGYVNHTGTTAWFPGSLGVLAFPVTWGCLLIRRVFRQENREMTAFCMGGFFAGMLIIFLDFCYGGVALRYLTDALPCFTPIGALLLMRLEQDGIDETIRGNGFAKGLNERVMLLLCLLTLLLCFCLGWQEMRGHVPDHYLYLERLLSIR